MAQIYLYVTNKMETVKALEEFRYTYDFIKKQHNLHEALMVFENCKLKQLEADTLICLARLSLTAAQLRKKSEDITGYFEIRKKYLQPCRLIIRN